MLKFYHAPWSRSSSILWLLEELGQPYEIEIVDIRAEGGVPESYRAIQPNKKVPAIDHDGTIVTERAAICLYLSEIFPEAGLAPAPGDEDRATLLTWLVYCDSVFDPAIAARAQGIRYAGNNFSFGTFEDLVANVERHLTANEFAAGERFTVADTQLASGIGFTMNVLKVLPERPVFKDYVARLSQRPAYQRAQEKDLAMAQKFPVLFAQ